MTISLVICVLVIVGLVTFVIRRSPISRVSVPIAQRTPTSVRRGRPVPARGPSQKGPISARVLERSRGQIPPGGGIRRPGSAARAAKQRPNAVAPTLPVASIVHEFNR
jgi:hypothetical protein